MSTKTTETATDNDTAKTRGVYVTWTRSRIQPVPDWANECSLQISAKCQAVGGNINAVSSKVSYVNSKLLGRPKYRKRYKMKHICRDCRELLRPAQRERRELWKSIRDTRTGYRRSDQ